VRAKDVKFATVFVTSKPLNVNYHDLDPTRTLIGFEPSESFPDGL